MGAIDLVVQIETPPSVASGLQRIGRAGHQAGAVSRGIIFPKYRGDLLATAAPSRAPCSDGAGGGDAHPAEPAGRAGAAAGGHVRGRRVDASTTSIALVRRAAPFSRLPRAQLEGVLDMLSGRYPSDEFAELRPRLTWDRLRGRVRAARGGAAPGRGERRHHPRPRALRRVPGGRRERASAASATAGRRVGELDEEMVFESREGEVFVLGASSWRIVEITRDRVLVEPAPGEPGKMPFWKGDRAGAAGRAGRASWAGSPASSWPRARETAQAAPRGAARARRTSRPRTCSRTCRPEGRPAAPARRPHDRARAHARRDGRLAAVPAVALGRPRARALGAGAQAHGCASAARPRWRRSGATTASSSACPTATAAGRDRPPARSRRDRGPAWCASWAARALFAAHFREAAGAGAAPAAPPARACARRSGCSASARADLLAVAARYGSFPIILETYRECLQDVFDLPALHRALARRVQRREVRRGHGGHGLALAVRGLAALRLRRQLHLRRRRAPGRAPRPGAGRRPGAAARAAGRGRAARAARPGGARRAGAPRCRA